MSAIKKLQVIVLNTAAVEEGLVLMNDGSPPLRLASKVDSITESLENGKQKVGTEISRGSEGVLPVATWKYGYGAGKYEDLMAGGIISPTKVNHLVRAASGGYGRLDFWDMLHRWQRHCRVLSSGVVVVVEAVEASLKP